MDLNFLIMGLILGFSVAEPVTGSSFIPKFGAKNLETKSYFSPFAVMIIPLVLTFDNNLVERMQGEIRNRNKTQRGLKSEDTVFVKGYQLYHNFIIP